MSDLKVKIVGGGLIGGSISLALTEKGVPHQVTDLDPTVLSKLSAKGDDQEEIPSAEISLVIVAVPPLFVLEELQKACDEYPNAVIIDVASVKNAYQSKMIEKGLSSRYVGTHPMSGKETMGAEAADPNLFADRVWIICPNADNKNSMIIVKNFVLSLGAIPVEMTAEEHDSVVGILSHLPQMISSTLASVAVEANINLDVAGPAFRDMTRIASSDPELWTQILMSNQTNATLTLDQMIDKLNCLREYISEKNRDEIFGYFQNAQLKAGNLPGKHGGRATRFGEISILVKDEPGSLANLFALAQKISLNIEDIYIEHVLNRPLAVVRLFVNPTDLDRAKESYRAEGWELRD